MKRVCDECLLCEQTVDIQTKIHNLELDQERVGRIVRSDPNSEHYAAGLVNGCRIVMVNEVNVELMVSAEIITRCQDAHVPFKIVLDYTNAEMSYQALLARKDKVYDQDTPS